MKINGQPEGGQGGGLTPTQEALINQVPNKVNQVRLVTDGSAIRHEGALEPLTFSQIYDLVMDNSKYVYIVMDNNIRFRPSAYDGDAIWFDSSFIEEGKPNILRCIINSDNRVDITQIVVASEEYVDEKVAEAGGLTPEQKKAVDTLVDSKDGYLNSVVIPALSSYENYNDGLPNDSIWIQNDYAGESYSSIYNNGYYISKLNKKSLVFEKYRYTNGISTGFIWEDNSGRLYNRNAILNEDGNWQDLDLGASVQSYEAFSNLFYIDNDIYLQPDDYSICMKFNEESGRFEDVGITVDTIDGGYITLYSSMIHSSEGYYFTFNGEIYQIVLDNNKLTFNDTGIHWDSSMSNHSLLMHNGELYIIDSFNIYKWDNENQTRVEFINLTGNSTVEGRYLCVYGNLLYGLQYPSAEHRVVNIGNNEIKNTSWKSNLPYVDLSSNQNVKGLKTFDSINTGSISSNSYSSSSYMNINANNDINIESNGNVNVKSDLFVKGDICATKSDTIQSKSVEYPGTLGKQLGSYYNIPYYFYGLNVFKGKIYRIYENSLISFDGTNWTETPIDYNFSMYTNQIMKVTSDRCFVVADYVLYELTESGITYLKDILFTFDDVIPFGDTLLSKSGKKLNLQTMEFEDYCDPFDLTTTSQNWYEYDGVTYSFDSYEIKYFNTSTNTFETFVTLDYYSNQNHFYHNGKFYVYDANWSRWHQIDVESKVDTIVNIFNKYPENPYLSLGDKVYCFNGNGGEYYESYNISYTKPEVPESDGTYVLKATRVGDQITYTWVVE